MSRLNIKLEAFESVDSTNTYLKNRAFAGAPEGSVVIANTQTAGRGRQGRAFASAQGLGVYMSLLLRPSCAPEDAQSLTANTAVAVALAIERVSGLSCDIKWINDLYMGGKKICGILCESATDAEGNFFTVVGIGLNVITRTEDFPEELRETAGSIYTQSGKIIERGKLISAIVDEMSKMYAVWENDKSAYLPDYKARCKMLGHAVTVSGAEGNDYVLASDILPDFALKVIGADGETRIYHSGEVSVRFEA